MSFDPPSIPSRAELPPHWFPTARRVHIAQNAAAPTIDIAIPYTKAPIFGDERQQRDYVDSVQAQLQTQTSQHAVAPRCTVETTRGKLTGGEAIPADDVGGGLVPRQLVRVGVVTQIEAEVAAVRSAPPSRYRVACTSLITRRGILVRGASITAADLAEVAREGTPARPAHVSDDGVAMKAVPAVPARPATDGKAQLTHLIERGRVVDTEAHANAAPAPAPTPTPKGGRR